MTDVDEVGVSPGEAMVGAVIVVGGEEAARTLAMEVHGAAGGVGLDADPASKDASGFVVKGRVEGLVVLLANDGLFALLGGELVLGGPLVDGVDDVVLVLDGQELAPCAVSQR